MRSDLLWPGRWLLALLGAALAAAAVVPLAVAQAPPTETPPEAPDVQRGAAPVAAFAAAGERWAWLRDEDGQSVLYAGGPAEPAREITRGAGWTDIATDGESAWVLLPGEDESTLLRVSLAGGAPEVERTSAAPLGGLFAAEGVVYWLEIVPPAADAPPFLPISDARAQLWQRAPSGPASALGTWPVGVGAAPVAGDIVGVGGEWVYVRVRRLVSTEFWRLPIQGGTAERVAAESGQRAGTLHNGVLHWATASVEATPNSGLQCVRRLTEEGAAEVVTDWLPPAGTLLSAGGELYYVSSDGVLRVPRALAPPVHLRGGVSGGAASDGARLISLGAVGSPRPLPL